MSTLFTINACKTFGCRNLGLASSEDYSWPDYKLGYPALHCRACGSYPPLFDEQQFRDWLSVHLSTYAIEKGHFCPVCYGTDMICYGHNPQGSQRIQCRNCKKVWTPLVATFFISPRIIRNIRQETVCGTVTRATQNQLCTITISCRR